MFKIVAWVCLALYRRAGAAPLQRDFALHKRASFHAIVAVMALTASLLAPQPAVAQESGSVVSLLKGPDRSSPQAWIASFTAEAATLELLLRAYASDATNANLLAYSSQQGVLRQFFDLNTVPAAFQTTVGNEAVAQMIDILNRLPDTQISAETAPPGAAVDPKPLWAIPATDIVLIRRMEGADAGNYVIPREVIVKLPDYHRRAMDLPLLHETDFPRMRQVQANLTGPLVPQTAARALSEWLDAPLLGAPSWKLLVAFLAALFTIGGNIAVHRFVKAATGRHSAVVAASLKLSGPLLLAGSFVTLAAFCQTQLIIQGYAALVVAVLRNLFLIGSGAWAVLALANIGTEIHIRSKTGPDRGMDTHLARLIGQTFGVVGVIAVVAYGLGTLGIPTAGIITSLGVGGVGIAFATRVTMENLFGGFVLLIDRPFRIGDRIKITAGEGVVTDIGARSCRIKTLDGHTLTIPNGALSASAITNIRTPPSGQPDQ
ncbi:Mechanosensitive ion channel [Gemmobacter aquatilis]|uniref:Mechanosensitive ion channel n=1 Tax=Gemmobacter aquatilis TaxID=933059 RepID=A0A1H7YEI9_9RHOB|nr:mechanosensitive ion channel domain-containing protein [Gemmobacter aquatilis]SEM44550.1 Mechanosensitive ion channel [Gemmobacter aquatilis]